MEYRSVTVAAGRADTAEDLVCMAPLARLGRCVDRRTRERVRELRGAAQLDQSKALASLQGLHAEPALG